MKLRRRLITACIIANNLANAIEDGDLSEIEHAVFHLRRKLRQASQELERVETALEPPVDVFRGRRRFTAPDDLP